MKRRFIQLLAGLALSCLPAPAHAASRSWNGGAGDWFDPTKWDGGGSCPSPGDAVTISSGSILLTNSTPYLDTLTITNATITFTNWTTALQSTNIIMQNNGKFQHAVCNTNAAISNTNRIYVLCSNLTINAGSSINASNSGYIGGRFGQTPAIGTGPGGGGSQSDRGGAGSYGGRGGTAPSTPSPGSAYGSAGLPIDPGSGAGGGNAFGGNGGGAIWIQADGDVLVHGTINASGGDGSGDQSAPGSGGGIYINCLKLDGTGSLHANGGNRGGNNGGGGGGRIAIVYNTTAQQTVSPKPRIVLSVAGGAGYSSGGKGSVQMPDTTFLSTLLAHTGRFYLPGSPTWDVDSLTVSNGTIEFATGILLSITNDLTVKTNGWLIITNAATLNVGNNIVLTNNGILQIHSAPTNGVTAYGTLVSVTNALAVAPGARLYPCSEGTNGGSVKFLVGNFLVAAGGTVDADQKGFIGSKTPVDGYGYGGGKSSGDRGGGGGYGGGGGRANTGTAGGPTYGSATAPSLPGSGGGCGGNGIGGNGGGLIWVSAGDLIDIRGNLAAGGGRAGDQNGGGSGGGIYLSAPRITGTGGVVRADGGGLGSNSGGGGGGRIAFTGWMTNQFDGTASATGGTGFAAGTNGTIAGVWNGSYPFSLTVRGSPLRHEISTPYDYGAYAMTQDAMVTNYIPQVAEQITERQRYYLLGWSVTNDVGTTLASGTTTNAAFTVSTNAVQTWIWTNQWYFKASAAPGGGLLADPTGWFTNASPISVTSTSAVGWVFSAWVDDGIVGSVPFVDRTNNPITLTMDQARLIKATFVDTTPQTRYWSGTNTWLDGTNNWNPTGVPGPNDTLIVTNGMLIIPSAGQALSLTVSNATVMFTNWLSLLTVNDVAVQSNGIITHAVCNTNAGGTTNRIYISTSNLTVEAGGLIDANGKGYAGGYNTAKGQGPGGGAFLSTSGGGGGHGGVGSTSSHGGAGGSSYGSPYAPSLPGSGGAGVSAAYGGNGGGVVFVQASGAVTLNGTVRASGVQSAGGKNGGGAGGSIWITCRTLSGSGDLQANGGSGGDNESGKGGGGRIAVYYDQPAQALVIPQPTARYALTNGTTGTTGAQPGTLYLPSSTFFPDRLSDLLQNNVRLYGVTSWFPTAPVVSNSTIRFEEGNYQFQSTTDLVVYGSAGSLWFTNATASVGGSIYMTSGGSLTMVRGTNSADTLAIGGDIRLDNGTMSYQYPLWNPTGLTFAGSIVLTNGGKLYLQSGATNGASPGYGAWLDYGSKNLVIPTNCGLFLYSHPTNGGSLKFTVGNLTVAPGGQLSGDGGGFAGKAAVYGYGPGTGQGDNNSAGGGGYGGVGGHGNHMYAYGGTNYGSTNMPLLPGSAGGGLPNPYIGGAGGSLLWIEANRVTLNGTITANGAVSAVGNGGSGSGGGIYIVCGTFAGGASGVLQARGGNKNSEGGPGGGGRIAVWRIRDSGAPGVVSVDPGTYAYATPPPGTGTVCWVMMRTPGTVFVVQ